jgi:type I restriction enzyme S subunit
VSRIDDLIKQFCPDGVVFKELSEIGTLYGGLTGKSKSDFSEGNARFITYMNIFSNVTVNLKDIGYVKVDKHERQTHLKIGDVLFTGSSETPNECGMSSVVTELPSEPIYLNSFSFGFRPIDEAVLLPEFSKYLFRDIEIRKQITKSANGVTRFNISKKRFLKIRIPVPPIGVQREIAKTLNSLTELESELKAELGFRKKQFEYYRNQLLTFDESREIRWTTLGEIVEKNTGGGTPSKAVSSYWNGDIPWASVGDLSLDGALITNTRNHITLEGLNHSSSNIVAKGDVIVAVKIAPGKMKIAGIDIAINQDLRGLRLRDSINSKFLYYFFQTINVVGNGTIVKGIRVDTLNKIKVPVPPMTEQERIVSILDKFDALVHDISDGLPAEITARRKQYEYYRGKLLTFQEVAS